MAKLFDEAAYSAAAETALRAFPIAPARITFVRVSENVTYRVTEADSGRNYTLRLHRPGYHSLASLKSERAWSRALLDAAIPVPEPVVSVTGEDYVAVRVEANDETRWVGVTRWVEGDLLSEVLDAETAPEVRAGFFSQVGAMLGAAHNQASAWTPPGEFARHRLDADGLMGKRPFWGPFWEGPGLSPSQRDLLLTTRGKIRDILLRYGQAPDVFSMIHADLHPGNILVSGDKLVMIDLDDAAFGWHLYDIAVALRSYVEHVDFALCRSALIDGYRAVRDLSDDDLALLPMFLLSRRLAELGWVSAREELGGSARLASMTLSACGAAEAFEPPF